MEPSLPVFAGAKVASASLDGLPAVVPVVGSTVAAADGISAVEALDERDGADETEFWDACWTLEDEWIPRAVVRPEPRVRRVHTAGSPTSFTLL